MACAVPVVAGEPSSPSPIGNPGDWATSDDYPAAALRADIEGVVRFVLGVAADGSVTDCTVSETSGDAGLDAKTCELLRARARFSPARDADGNATTGTWSSAVRWQIPGSTALPPIMTLTYRFVVEKDGTVSSCEVLSDSVGRLGDKACANTSKLILDPMQGKDGSAVRSATTMTFDTQRVQLSD